MYSVVSIKEIYMATVSTYTPEVTARMVEAYKASPSEATVKALAAEFGKSARSVVAKLASEKVYVATAKTKAAAKATKADKVASLASLTGVEAAKLASLEKATAEALDALVEALTAAEVKGE